MFEYELIDNKLKTILFFSLKENKKTRDYFKIIAVITDLQWRTSCA